MQRPMRGALFAIGVLGLPLVAKADCPPEASIERYAQTAGDALTALNGLVPASQQAALEDRYGAMLVLKWNWNGADALTDDTQALEHLRSCASLDRCSASASDGLVSGILAEEPSVRLLSWAESVLDCPLTTVSVDAEEASSDLVADDEATESPDGDTLATDPGTSEGTSPPLELAEADTPSQDEDTNTASLASIAPPQPITGDPAALMKTAAAAFAAGAPAAALPPLKQACLIEAQQVSRSDACETLFDVYNAPTARGRESANSPDYLAFSDQLCAIGYVRGCENMALYYGAQTTAEAHVSTVAYTERACDLGDGNACVTVSNFYLTGRASAPDPVRALAKLEQACTLGRLTACQDAADFHLRGVGGEIDVLSALKVNEASCPENAAERPDICVAAADFILINMQSGPERAQLVRAFTERACDIGHDIGCAWYAENLELGLGGRVDASAAKQARVKACEFGHRESCASGS